MIPSGRLRLRLNRAVQQAANGSENLFDHLIGAGEHDVGLQPHGMGRRLHISRHRFSYPYSRFAAHVEKADASKEMQRRRMGMITNFLLSPLVNLVWG